MKLRNKKTGDIVDYNSFGFRKGKSDGWDDFVPYAKTLAELNEEWEDYIPKEPIIKDEKIRKAVRAWAEANSQRTSISYQQLDETNSCISFIDFGGLVIEFNKPIDGLTSGKTYKFTELCGEEEE